jgi:hypothetical protein
VFTLTVIWIRSENPKCCSRSVIVLNTHNTNIFRPLSALTRSIRVLQDFYRRFPPPVAPRVLYEYVHFTGTGKWPESWSRDDGWTCLGSEASRTVSAQTVLLWVPKPWSPTGFFLWIPFYLQAVQIHSANRVKLLEAWRGVLSSTPSYK